MSGLLSKGQNQLIQGWPVSPIYLATMAVNDSGLSGPSLIKHTTYSHFSSDVSNI